MMNKNTICIWYDGTALEAAEFYAKTFAEEIILQFRIIPHQLTHIDNEFALDHNPCIAAKCIRADKRLGVKFPDLFYFQPLIDGCGVGCRCLLFHSVNCPPRSL